MSAELAAARPEPVLSSQEAGVPDGSGGPPGGDDGPLGWNDGPPHQNDGPPGRHARRPVRASGRLAGWLEDRLPPSLQGRVRIGAGHLALLTTVAAVAMALLAWSVVRSADPGDLAPARADVERHRRAEPLTALAPPAAPPVGASQTSATETAEVVVDVAGKVRRPGIVRLPAGSRVVDAVEAAGGPRRGVALTGLNLARVLTDGEQVLVGVPGPTGPAAATAPGAAPGAVTTLVNLNTATQVELETLPGVGPVTATSILEWRTEHGAFSRVDELLEVSGIGDATLAEIAPHVTI